MATLSPSERAALLLRRSTAAAAAEAVVGRRHCSQHVKPVQHYTTLHCYGAKREFTTERERGCCVMVRGKKITCTRATPVPASWGNTYLILGAIRLGQGHSIHPAADR